MTETNPIRETLTPPKGCTPITSYVTFYSKQGLWDSRETSLNKDHPSSVYHPPLLRGMPLLDSYVFLGAQAITKGS